MSGWLVGYFFFLVVFIFFGSSFESTLHIYPLLNSESIQLGKNASL